MKTAELLNTTPIHEAYDVAESKTIARDQNWCIGITKYTFDDNSVLVLRGPDSFGFDADSSESIRAYAEWLGSDIDDCEREEIERLIDAVQNV